MSPATHISARVGQAFWLIFLGVTACSDSIPPTRISVEAPGVRLASYKLEAGKVTDAQLQEGLQSAADALSAVYAEARKTQPRLKGHLRGTMHIEPAGTVKMFAESDSEFSPAEGKIISDKFVEVAFAKKWQFPRIGTDLMLTVDFDLAPGN